jgi:hypothetical protein
MMYPEDTLQQYEGGRLRRTLYRPVLKPKKPTKLALMRRRNKIMRSIGGFFEMEDQEEPPMSPPTMSPRSSQEGGRPRRRSKSPVRPVRPVRRRRGGEGIVQQTADMFNSYLLNTGARQVLDFGANAPNDAVNFVGQGISGIKSSVTTGGRKRRSSSPKRRVAPKPRVAPKRRVSPKRPTMRPMFN